LNQLQQKPSQLTNQLTESQIQSEANLLTKFLKSRASPADMMGLG